MTERTVKTHRLGDNKSTHSPARWLFFDTETLPEQDGDLERHNLRLWCATLVERRGPSLKRPRPTTFEGHTAGELADAVESACHPSESLYVCAHNLGFDLAVTELPLVLAERGWTITQHALTGNSPWMRIKRGSAHLTLVDSHSWLPVPEHVLGDQLELPKGRLPAWSEPDEAWFERCRGDVRILELAMLELLDWWDERKLGHWSISGPGTGFNSYKHRGFIESVVIQPDPAARTVERSCIYGGRAEAFRVGRFRAGHYAFVDFSHAYGSVCTSTALPRSRMTGFDSMPLEHRATGASRVVSMIAECEVETSSPRYPLRTARGVIHPVGRFRTILAGPEVKEAKRRGELRAIGAGYTYHVTPHMTFWAQWALNIVEGREPAPPTARIAVKHWTRTVPGRWAGRTGRTALTLEQPVPGWRMTLGRHHPTGARAATVDMAGKQYWIVQDQDMDDCFPAVLAFIQSELRVKLSRLIDLLGADAVIMANTDGALIDLEAWYHRVPTGAPASAPLELMVATLEESLAAWSPELAPLTPRVKDTYRNLEVLSPQHLIADNDRQLAGVPRSATNDGDHHYSFTDWPALSTQLQIDGPGYVRRPRTVNLSAVPVLRWVTDTGRTEPVMALYSPQEARNVLQPWSDTPVATFCSLAPVQHPLLEPLRPPHRRQEAS